MPEALAIFMLGGAANGKSSVVRALFCTDENPEDFDLPALDSDRWCSPDREKRAILMFTDAPGDDEAVDRFRRGANDDPKLGGASGPPNRSEFERYPPEVCEQATRLVCALGAQSIADFANRWLTKQNPEGEGNNFGAGLTHEISKALAIVKLLRCLGETNPEKPFVWDAIGNPDNYIPWIERACRCGYQIRIIYVRCPLAVAQMWALRRPRSISPTLVYETYLQASDAASKLRAFAESEGLEFEEYDPSTPDDFTEARRLGCSDADPAAEGRQKR